MGKISPVPVPVKAHGEHFFPIPVPTRGFNPRGDPHPRISLEVLAGDDGEVGDDGIGVEGELPERGPVLAEQLVDQRLLGGAGGAIGGSGGGGGCARRGFLAPPGSGPAADLRAEVEAEASMGTAEAEARMTGGWAVGGRQARVWGAWERERAGEGK